MTRRRNKIRVDSTRRFSTFGFTLIELLVVMAVIAIIGTIVLAAFQSLGRNIRLSSGTNSVSAALGSARAQAMKTSEFVVVVFRPKLLDDNTQVIEMIMAQWTGQSMIDDSGSRFLIDRFIPIPGEPIRRMPRGIKLAGPLFAETTDVDDSAADEDFRDDNWATQAQLTAIDQNSPLDADSEPSGRMIGVLFNPTGGVVSQIPTSNAIGFFIDFNEDGMQSLQGLKYNFGFPGLGGDDDFPGLNNWDHRLDDDEPIVIVVPFLAVYDDVEFREFFEPTDWVSPTNVTQYETDLRQYIGENANRIHFNSYTGVSMR
ncbi:MAG: prepilin-type N-terminal cleavage/methylation domain-containing protein [Planctomycetota bacterium]|nr:prepilin-type N-terminal cleavage/methylation domain-containing protein [Planctomycetota bacterium]